MLEKEYGVLKRSDTAKTTGKMDSVEKWSRECEKNTKTVNWINIVHEVKEHSKEQYSSYLMVVKSFIKMFLCRCVWRISFEQTNVVALVNHPA